MARLPTPGGDSGNWGTILNDYLSQIHKSDGSLKDNVVTSSSLAPAAVTSDALAVDAVDATVIQDGSITNVLIADSTIEEAKLSSAVQSKLNQTAPVTSVNAQTGDISLTADDVLPSQTGNNNKVLSTNGTTASWQPAAAGDMLLATYDPAGIGQQVVGTTATQTLTGKTISGLSNTITNVAQGSIINLTSDLSSKVSTSITVNGHALSGNVTVTKSDIGLGNVDNTSDANKPISTATQTALDGKVGTSDSRLTDTRTPTDNTVTAAKIVDASVTLSKLSSGVQASLAKADMGNAIPSAALLSNLPNPFYIAHRGEAAIVPENTLEGFRVSSVMGAYMLEMDVVVLADGSLGVMHDTTVDRTTAATGNVSAHTAISWKQLSVDASSWFGAGWSDTHPPLFSEVLKEHGNKTILVPEAKSSGSMAPMIAALQRYGIDPRTVLLQADTLADAITAKNAGYTVVWLYTTDYATAASNSIPYIGPDSTTVTQPMVTNAAAAGVKIIPYTVNRRVDADRLTGWGCAGVFSDESLYVGRASGVSLRTDPFDSMTWFSGIMANNSDRGKFYSGGSWGWDLNGSVPDFALHGWATPTNGSAFTIDATVQIDAVNSGDMTRWISFFLGTTDQAYTDAGATGGPAGYHFLVRANGTLAIYRRDTNSASATLLGSQTGTALTLGVSGTVRITVTASTLKIERTDAVTTSITVTDNTYRPIPYLTLGRNSAGGRFSNFTIS